MIYSGTNLYRRNTHRILQRTLAQVADSREGEGEGEGEREGEGEGQGCTVATSASKRHVTSSESRAKMYVLDAFRAKMGQRCFQGKDGAKIQGKDVRLGRFRVSGFGLEVGFGSQGWRFSEIHISCFGFRVSGFDFGFRDQ